MDWLSWNGLMSFWGAINTPTALHPSAMPPSLHPSRPEVYTFPTSHTSPDVSSPILIDSNFLCNKATEEENINRERFLH